MVTERDKRLLPALVDEEIPSSEDLLFLAIHQRRVIGIRHGIAHRGREQRAIEGGGAFRGARMRVVADFPKAPPRLGQ